MRRITLFVASTIILLVLLFSYRTSRGPGAASQPPAALTDNQVGVVPQPDPTGASRGEGSPGPSTSDSTVVNGTISATRWGPVQVQVVISGGRITDLVALRYPTSNGRDQQINAYALPILRDRVLAAQSSGVDVVTGATVTSVGYLHSVQAALDMAHFSGQGK
jgi:uncharacterized protein with FMN-binding domain